MLFKLFYNGWQYEIGGSLLALTYQIEMMFNRSRWDDKCTATPLFYICCCSAFLFMIKKLEDCNVGDLVRIWCIGTLCWDDEVVKIIDKSVLITVQYQSGRTGRFSSSAECKVVSF